MNFCNERMLPKTFSFCWLGGVFFACFAACLLSLHALPCLGQSVLLTDDVVDSSADNVACFKIETPAATYFLEKEGAGLSSLLDADGIDWIGFHPKKGSGAHGEYRGFPNAVYKEGGSFFHPKNAGTDPSTCRVVKVEPDCIEIEATSNTGAWSSLWKFTPTHCTYTMTKIAPGKKYWVLYEGTPGGECDDNDWWMTSAIKEKKPLSEQHQGDIPAPEWIAFGDAKQKRALFLYHVEDDKHEDRFYLMNESMTVFGFGREKLNKYLDSVPQTFVIGFIESTSHAEISNRIEVLADQNP